MKTSLCTLGTAATVAETIGAARGTRLPSSAISVNPATVAAAPAPVTPVVCAPTIEGTCMRKPALTRRTKTVPVLGFRRVAGAVGKRDQAALVLLNGPPWI